MEKYNLKWITLILALFVIQSSFLPLFHIHSVGPDLLLLTLLSYSFFNGKTKGAGCGFFIGIFQDLASGTFFGYNTLTKILIGVGAGSISSRSFRDNFLIPIFLAFMGTIASYLIMLLLTLLQGYRFNLVLHIVEFLPYMLIYNLIFAYPIHFLVRRINGAKKDENKV